MKNNPFISLPGCVTAIIFIAVMVAVTFALGGVMFSPGALSAQGSDRAPIMDFKSHVDFEGRCEFCHAPWQGVVASLCEDCHANVANERTTSTGIHGVLKDSNDCKLCHVEHRGRNADQSALAMVAFPHEQTGYSLVQHQKWTNGQRLACRDCHDPRAPNYQFDASWCEACHRKVDMVFVDQHIARYSADCLACHRDLQPFDHHTFPLVSGHAKVACDRCHASGDFTQVKADCVTCHQDPQLHAGLFGTDCAACHTIEGWSPAKLAKHSFPLDHGGEGEIACVTCHAQTYKTYTCYNCHAHDPTKDRETHVKAGILVFDDCMKCHADGKTHKQMSMIDTQWAMFRRMDQ